jgi:hypothetical protein
MEPRVCNILNGEVIKVLPGAINFMTKLKGRVDILVFSNSMNTLNQTYLNMTVIYLC